MEHQNFINFGIYQSYHTSGIQAPTRLLIDCKIESSTSTNPNPTQAKSIMSGINWRPIFTTVSGHLHRNGLDISTPLSMSWYNDIVKKEDSTKRLVLPFSGDSFCILYGNSRAIWEPFTKDFKSSCEKGEANTETKNPLEDYVEKVVSKTMRELPSSLCTDEYGCGLSLQANVDVLGELDLNTTQQRSAGNKMDNSSSKTTTGVSRNETAGSTDNIANNQWDKVCNFPSNDIRPGRLVHLQLLADIVGLAQYVKEVKICVHPKYGPWFALRGLLVFPNVKGPDISEKQKAVRNIADTGNILKSERMMKNIISRDIRKDNDWLEWVRLRDLIDPDHKEKYASNQMLYYYFTGPDKERNKILLR